MTATEYILLVDEANNEIGKAEKITAHAQNMLHRAFSVFIFRKQPQLELLLQQRAMHKYHSHGLWTNTCCSHPRLGEDILLAGRRRLQEELGFTASLTDLGWFHYNAHFANGLSENEIDHVLLGFVPEDVTIHPNKNEVHAHKWVTLQALESDMQNTPEQFTPWLKQALGIVKSNIGAL